MAWTTATNRILQWTFEMFGQGRSDANSCRAGDYDFYLVALIEGRDDTGALAALDISGVSGAGGSMAVVLISPEGTRYTKTLSLRSGGTDGLAHYLVASGDLEEVGRWEIYAEIDWDGSSKTTSQMGSLHVEGAGYRGPEKKNDLAFHAPDFNINVARGVVRGHSAVTRYGRNEDIDSGDGNTADVWSTGGTRAYLSSAETMSIVSSSANDDGAPAGTGAHEVHIEGLNSSFNEIDEVVTLNGTGAVTTSHSYLRVDRAYVGSVGSGGVNAGAITIDPSSSGSGSRQGTIEAEYGETQISHYTIPNGKYGFVTMCQVGAGHTSGNITRTLRFRMFTREQGESWRIRRGASITMHGASVTPDIAVYIPDRLDPKTDIRWTARSTASDTIAYVTYNLILVDADLVNDDT